MKPPSDPAAFAAKIEEADKAYRKHRLKETQTALDEALAMAPNHPDALALLSHVQLETDKQDDAFTTASTCVKLDGSKAECWLVLAVVQQERDAVADAITAWERYVELEPEGLYADHGRRSLKRLRSQAG